MRNFRIIFTETEPRGPGGNMVDVECGTKWMTAEEAAVSKFMHKRNARIVERS